jgi:hypothetical protein
MWRPIPVDSEDGKILFFNNMLGQNKSPVSASDFREFMQAPISNKPEFSYLIEETPDPFGGSHSWVELNTWESLIYVGGRSVFYSHPLRSVEGCELIVDDVTTDIVGLVYYMTRDAEKVLTVFIAAMFKPMRVKNLEAFAHAFVSFLYRKRCRYSRIEIRVYESNPFKEIYNHIDPKYFHISKTIEKDYTELCLTAVETT